RANRTTKINAEHFRAFASPNYPALGESGVHLKVNREYLWRKARIKDLVVHTGMDRNNAILTLFAGFDRFLLRSILGAPGLKALVLETYGAGNAPMDDWFLNDLREATSSGLHIVNVTQCSGGSVQMGEYETSEALKEMQILNGKNITTEAAITKLMYLIGSNVSHSSFKTIFETSLRGEVK